MNILYWNVCSAAKPDRIIEEAADLITTEQIDVACLQEVPYRDDLPISAAIAKEVGMGGTFEHTRTLAEDVKTGYVKGYGTTVLTSLGIKHMDATWLREDKWSYMTKGRDNKRVLVTLQTEEEPDIMINVAHLSYTLPLWLGRSGLVKERNDLTRKLQEQVHDYGVVFGGDINAPPGSEIDRRIVDLPPKGFQNIVNVEQPTFRSRHLFTLHAKRNLDRVFVSRDLSAQARIGERRQSDHHPIIVEVS